MESAVVAAGGPQRLKAFGSGRGTPPAEEDLWIGSYSPKAMFGSFLAAAVLTALGAIAAAFTGPIGWIVFVICAAVAWCYLALVLVYRRLTVRYRLSTFRFFHDTGLLSRTGNRVEVIDIDDVTVRQGFIERLLGVGTISIRSSDTTDPQLDLPGIDDAKRVADLIDGTRRAERQRRGMFMENV
jgi:uncharacterized membrane protein YdbT with pleckstrin-like domain